MRMIFSIRSLLLVLGMLAMSAVCPAQVGIGLSVNIAPPELPVYDQPVCPGDGYIWTPGYWSYADDGGYYWVPGDWVMAPEVGFLWTPGYWGWGGSSFLFHEGYWGPEVGFYGGVSYGFGYFGHGYEGGRWDNGHFFYNRSVTNVNVTINRNVYNTEVRDNRSGNRVSFNGGRGGINDRPTAQESAAANQRHVGPVPAQTEHVQTARANPEQRDSANHGKPPITATQRPAANGENGAAAGREPVAARGTSETGTSTMTRPVVETGHTNNETPRPTAEAARPSPAVHAKDLPPAEHLEAPNTGNAKKDQKYQQQQQKLQAQQVKERQSLQQKQEQDHQRAPQKAASPAKQQHMEQQHQQQTQQLSQKHAQQQQQMQQRQQPAPHPAAASKPTKQ